MLLSPIKVKQSGEIVFDQNGIESKIASIPDDRVMRYKHSIPTGLLPPVVRYMHPSRQIVVFDRPPTQVTINFFGKKLGEYNPENGKIRKQEYDVWLPWTVYIIYLNQGVISEIYLYAIDGPFDSMKKKLRLLPIPNYYPDGRFCQPEELQPFKSVADAVSKAYQIVWNSNFNLDTIEALYHYYSEHLNFLSRDLGVHEQDTMRQSTAGILHAWSKLTKTEVLELSDKWLQCALIPRAAFLPTFKYNPTPARFGNFINEFKLKSL